MPWDVALSLDSVERAAFCIIAGELRGGEFDWSAGRWREKKS